MYTSALDWRIRLLLGGLRGIARFLHNRRKHFIDQLNK